MPRFSRFPALAAAAVVVAAAGLLASCGGSATNASISGGGLPTPGSAVTQYSSLSSCQNSYAAFPQLSTAYAANEAPMIVDPGPCALNAGSFTASTWGAPGTVYTSVTICAPGSNTNCQTIDHVQVDTGSVGVRILASAISSALLPQLAPVASGSLGYVNDCYGFADGWTWGVLRTADVRIGGAPNPNNGFYTNGETAAGISVDIIGDPKEGPVPAACSNLGVAENTVATFGANGIIGMLPVPNEGSTYYACTASGCSAAPVTISLNLQANNPVYSFATDKNGIIVHLDPVPTGTGAPVAYGALVFGVGTQPNNLLATAPISSFIKAAPTEFFAAVSDPTSGLTSVDSQLTSSSAFSVTPGSVYQGIFDSGTTVLVLPGTTVPTAANQEFAWTTSPSTLTMGATIQGSTAGGIAAGTPLTKSYSLSFPLTSAYTLGAYSNNWAFDDLGATATTPNQLVWGSPFFFGRSIYVGFTGSNFNIGGTNYPGPFYAY